ncbi:MAG: hypothetical protein ACWA45_08415 [Flavobacteriales bacterium]
MVQFGVDGIAISLSKMTKSFDSIINIRNTLPLVLFDKASDKVPCAQVIINDEEAAYMAVEHLINIRNKEEEFVNKTIEIK